MQQIRGFKKINLFNHFNLWQKNIRITKNILRKTPLKSRFLNLFSRKKKIFNFFGTILLTRKNANNRL